MLEVARAIIAQTLWKDKKRGALPPGVPFGRFTPLSAIAKRGVAERLFGTPDRFKAAPPPRAGKPDEQARANCRFDHPFEAVRMQQSAHRQQQEERETEQSDGDWNFVDGDSLTPGGASKLKRHSQQEEQQKSAEKRERQKRRFFFFVRFGEQFFGDEKQKRRQAKGQNQFEPFA